MRSSGRGRAERPAPLQPGSRQAAAPALPPERGLGGRAVRFACWWSGEVRGRGSVLSRCGQTAPGSQVQGRCPGGGESTGRCGMSHGAWGRSLNSLGLFTSLAVGFPELGQENGWERVTARFVRPRSC